MTNAEHRVPENIAVLTSGILQESPLHKSFIDAAFANLRAEELTELSKFLDYCAVSELSVDYLVDSYLTLVEDTISEQMYFNEHRHYRYSSFKEVADKVYFDPDYMGRYMHGLAISSFLWPNHVAITRYFRDTLPTAHVGSYLEVGPGHGQFMLTAMQRCAYDSYTGIDISATSTEQTRQIIDYFAPSLAANAHLETRDFLADDELASASFDAIVAGEVVEHVEQPEPFFRRIADLAKPGAHIFLTTCINTPAIDHLYLWRTPQELETMIQDCGLGVVEKLTLPYQGKTLEEALEDDLSVNYAFILEKRL